MKYKYDYYKIDLRFESWDIDSDELEHIAINEARERAKLYCMPAEWSVMAIIDGIYTVRRKRYRTTKKD